MIPCNSMQFLIMVKNDYQWPLEQPAASPAMPFLPSIIIIGQTP